MAKFENTIERYAPCTIIATTDVKSNRGQRTYRNWEVLNLYQTTDLAESSYGKHLGKVANMSA